MNDMLSSFLVALTPTNLGFSLLGVTLGTFVGLVPGIGPLAAMSLLLPAVFVIDNPTTAIIFLCGLYFGTQYGGSTTSILLNLPGEASSVVTAIDGHQLARQGEGKTALAVAALSSFFAGITTIFFIIFATQFLAKIAYMFGPAEYTALMISGMIASAFLTNGPLVKNFSVVLIGAFLGLVGADVNSGFVRFTFGQLELADGIPFVIIAMSVFGLSEMTYNFFSAAPSKFDQQTSKNKINWQLVKDSKSSTVRGTIVGSVLGLIPGGGNVLASYASYLLEKKISRTPERFGKGAIEGVAGPESANNAASQTNLIPTLGLGIPVTPVMGLMIAALIIQGVQPGPEIFSENIHLFWALIASMFISNIMLVILNLPLIGIWIKLLNIPFRLLYLLVIASCMVGTYYITYNFFYMLLLIPFTLLGLFLNWTKTDPAPMAVGFVLGAMLEENLRRALTLSQGNWLIFLEKPLSLGIILVTMTIFLVSVFSKKS